jgi:hypothetical protein
MLHQSTETASNSAEHNPASTAAATGSCAKFDDLKLSHNPATRLRQPRPDEIDALRQAGSRAMGVPVAPREVVERMLAHDPETLWVFETDGRITGGAAFLFLSETGVERLLAGRLDPHAPAAECLVNAGEPPAGVYFWGIYRDDPNSGGIGDILKMLETERFKGADLWTFPTGDIGRAFFERIGLRPVEAGPPNLYRRVRRPSGPSNPEG